MKGSGFVNALGFITGTVFMFLGVVFSIGGPLVNSRLDSSLQELSHGIRIAGNAVSTSTEGVSGSTGMIEEVRISLENTSSIVTNTGDVILQTVTILEELKVILPALANDMASMPSMVRNMMPANHFDEVAERTETVSTELGFLNTHLEDLSGDIIVVGGSIGEVAVSVEAMEQDLLSAEGSFGEAADMMNELASSLENGSFTDIVSISMIGLGILMFLAGLYQIFTGMMIRKLVKGQVEK
ncbi:MAG: hypothetical protein J7K88_08215 [Candidatus Fermentibacteraceae bacterium]|nr:hypothetical protein [Candidatus Fermentibacteraceae bacterium]